jgi:hypothetical protein
MLNALVKSSSTAVAIAQADRSIARIQVSRTVGDGIKALQVAFPVMAQTPDDRATAMRLYAKALEGFHAAEQEFALEWILFHNPRNTPTFTQPPTPQDVYECCKRVQDTWVTRITEHYLGSGYNRREFPEWGKAPGYTFSSEKKLEPLPWGPPPLASGCHVPDELVYSTMVERTHPDHTTDALVVMDPDRYARLIPEFFAKGRKEQIDALRKAKAEKEDAARRHEAYLDSLPADLRRARGKVLDLYCRRGEPVPAEPAIIQAANELLQRQAEDRAQRDAQWKVECERRRLERMSTTASVQ